MGNFEGWKKLTQLSNFGGQDLEHGVTGFRSPNAENFVYSAEPCY